MDKWYFFYWFFWIFLTVWIIKKKGKVIILPFFKERRWKFCYPILTFSSFFTFLHFAIKVVFFYSQRSVKIEKQIETINNIKQNASCQLLGIILVSCFLAPLVEEYIFRYLIFKFLGFKLFSYLLSFLFFIFWHYQPNENIGLLICQYFSATLSFILIYRSTKKLIYPIILHSLVNIFFISLVLINSDFPLI